MIIPLGTEDTQSQSQGSARIYLENMYLVDSPYSPDGISRISRPTLKAYLDLGTGPVNGLARQDGSLNGDWLILSNNTLTRYTPHPFNPEMVGTSTTIGTVGAEGAALIDFSFGADRVLMLKNGAVYSTDGVTVDVVLIPDGQLVSSITYMDSYFILTILNSERFYWISPGEDAPDALSFASAERLPDRLVSSVVIGDELWLLGQSSTEVWVTSGDPDAPFQRVSGRAYNFGCAENFSVVQTSAGGFPCAIWVSDKRTVTLAQGSPIRISNDSVEEFLRSATTLRAWTFQFNRHDFYILTSDQFTLVYDLTKKLWCRWSTIFSNYWTAHLGLQDGGAIYAAGYLSGKVYKLEEGVSDDGVPVVRTVSGLVLSSSDYEPCTRINVVMNSGGPIAYAGSEFLNFRMSDDMGATYPFSTLIPINRPSGFQNDAYTSGLGMIRRPGRLFSFSYSGLNRFRLDYATMNER